MQVSAVMVVWMRVNCSVVVAMQVAVGPPSPCIDKAPAHVHVAETNQQPTCYAAASLLNPLHPIESDPQRNSQQSQQHRTSDVAHSTECRDEQRPLRRPATRP